MRESATYYSLGATLEKPPKGRDGYRIELASARNDLEIRIRRRFVPRNAEESAREESESALLLGVRSTDLPVTLILGTTRPKKSLSRERVVPFSMQVPLDQLEFEEDGDEIEASVELTFCSAEPDGAKSDPQRVRVPIRFKKAKGTTGVRGTWNYDAEFLVKKGDLRFVVTARDLRSNRMGSAEASARIE